MVLTVLLPKLRVPARVSVLLEPVLALLTSKLSVAPLEGSVMLEGVKVPLVLLRSASVLPLARDSTEFELIEAVPVYCNVPPFKEVAPL